MKSKTWIVLLILILSVLVAIGSCATKRKVISDEEFLEVWSGTWINTDYGGDTQAKIINHPDGIRELFTSVTSTTKYARKEKSTILEKWQDSDGTIWYRGYWEGISSAVAKGYEMGKISNSGNTWEFLWASEDYPIEEWEPDRFEYNYRIYYRHE